MISPTLGRLTFKEMVTRIISYMAEAEDEGYRFIIGTDSQTCKGSRVVFVTAVIIHRIGRGAVYFYEKELLTRPFSLEERIYTEVSKSLTVASKLMEELTKRLESFSGTFPELEIHVDVGQNGKTRELVNAVSGMVKGCGFLCQTKPLACGASTVADRHTRIMPAV